MKVEFTRVQVCGTSGSGKTTLGRRLGEMLCVPHTELDALWHRENWTTASVEEFRSSVQAVVDLEDWVLDGNYSKVRDVILERVHLVIWLDYPLPLILRQLTRRTFGRWYRREVLWHGNREVLWRHLLVPKDSLFWWVLTTYKRRRAEFRRISTDPANAHVRFLRFSRPSEVECWLEGLREARIL
jgi:adenylate kinase family enzyme